MISISVIVPVYGVEKYVGRCVESVMAQATYFAGVLECVIVNDCTPDGSMEVVKGLLYKYAGTIRFKIIDHDKNLGLSEARNTGIKASSGDYILFLDSDDELMPGAIASFAQKVEEYTDVDMVVGEYACDGNSQHLRIKIKDDYLKGENSCKRAFLREKLFPDTAHNKLVRRKFLVDNGLYFRPGIYHEDNLWKWHCAKYVESVAFLRRPTMMYNVNPCSMSNKPIESRIESLMAIMKEKISTIDNCEHTAQLLNATLFLHQIDERSRRISDMAYYQKVKREIRRYAEALRIENLKEPSRRGSLSLSLLNLKLRLPLGRFGGIYRMAHIIARRLVN